MERDYRDAPLPQIVTETYPTKLEEAMAAAIIFMPEIGHLTVPVTRKIIQRCARVAVAFGAHINGSDS